MPKIDVYGLSHSEQQQLAVIARQKLGKKSVSLLAKTLLLNVLDSTNHAQAATVSEQDGKCRLELRLLPQDYQYLQTAAGQQGMSPNALAVSILRYYIDRRPALSNNEITALYQSNYQLLRIGRNLNQIARQLNAGESGGVTVAEIRQLMSIIDRHTESVGALLNANAERFTGVDWEE